MGSVIPSCDCLILGGGLAGWMAAREAAAAGLAVTLLQDGMGASPWVHGFNAPVVREGDSAEVFLRDTLQSGQGLSDPRLAAALCGDAGELFSELADMGLRFNREGDQYQALRPLGASYPRVVSIGNETGVAVLAKLREALAGRVNELPGVRALRLTLAGGRVTGALAYDSNAAEWRVLPARAVILATGGFCGIYPVSTNKRDSGGDGVAMAYEAGAELCDMEFIQFEPSAAVWPKELVGSSMITTLFFEGAVLRNREGERFMLRYGPEGERVGKDVMARQIAAEIAAGRGTEHGGVFFDATGVDPDRLRDGYQMYVRRYADVGIDLTKQWIELAPAPHTSLGGVRVDDRCRATVEGLFACGEVTGGLHGANRIGGSAGLETLVFGRRAGREAAAYAGSVSQGASVIGVPQPQGEPVGERLQALREDMRAALWGGVNAVRSGDCLRKAADVLEAGLRELHALRGATPQECYDRMRLHNDMLAALLTARAALARDDSLGCHARSDCPHRASYPYRVVLRRICSGETEIRKETIDA